MAPNVSVVGNVIVRSDPPVVTTETDVPFFSVQENGQGWGKEHEEGQLSVDVLETEEELIIVATMAGTKPEDIELHLHNDFLTIRGKRQAPVANAANYFYQECYWGKFSRTIVLPVDVKGELAGSEYRNGVLTVHLPKIKVSNSIPILVVED